MYYNGWKVACSDAYHIIHNWHMLEDWSKVTCKRCLKRKK